MTKAQIEIMKQIPFESVTRVRRELCSWSDPKYKPDKEVEDMRQQKYEEITARYGGGRQYCQSLLDKNKVAQEALPF